MYSLVNGRNPRSKTQMYNPMYHPFGNYCTEAIQKSEMKLDYENEIFLNNLHLIPDPLMKNLADTLVTSEKPDKVRKQSLESPIMTKQPSKEDVRTDSALAGITSFFSGVFNMLSGAMFRTRSQVHYYDCFDEARQGSPQTWRGANDGQDKNGKAPDDLSSDGSIPNDVQSDMNNCKAVSSCEEKINQVRNILSPTNPITNPKPSNPIWLRKKPKKVFVEPGSVEESFEDAISPEDFVALSNEPYIKCYSPLQLQKEELCQTEAPKTKVEVAPVFETTEIVNEMTENNTQKESRDMKLADDIIQLDSDKITKENNIEESSDEKHQLVSSCEDKLSKLKALLKEKRTKHTTIMAPSPEPIAEQPLPAKTIPICKPVDKHYKNSHRMLDKRRKVRMKRSIQDDVIFASEVDLESPVNSPSTPSTINSSSDTSLGDYFDELKGRFRSASTTESDDSFQVVFSDSPKRSHKASDCESEDSFIVFEDNDCYTSNDVFGDSDSESDVSDSGCSTMTCKLSHSLSRTVSNLTDDTLYESSDEVDCARVEPTEARGLLVDAARKNLKKDQPVKKVHFSSEPPTVKVMRVWAFASRQARAGHWERYALDRDRFKRRIADVDMAVSWVLNPRHRARVMFQRFMPLWNKQKRQELAEKKEKEAEKKRVEEQERIEEERRQEERIEEEKRIEDQKEDEKRVEEENLFLLFESLRRNVKKNGKNKKTFSDKECKVTHDEKRDDVRKEQEITHSEEKCSSVEEITKVANEKEDIEKNNNKIDDASAKKISDDSFIESSKSVEPICEHKEGTSQV